MLLSEISTFDFHSLWTWVLLFVRFSALLFALPGIGTEDIPVAFRTPLAIVLSLVLVVSGAKAEFAPNFMDGLMMMGVEALLGYFLGAIPAFVVAALSLSGTISATAIGLNQASVIDTSLGEEVTTLARIQSLLGTVLFLLLDGHHAVIRAASQISKDVGIGVFQPDMATAELFLNRFIHTFETGISIAAPIIVVSLILQFMLGLVTRFVPQVNVFIMSLPLTILVGLFVFEFTLPEMVNHVRREYGTIEETAQELLVR